MDAPLYLAGRKSPMLNNAEKEFNILRKIVLWQSAILYKRGIGEIAFSIENQHIVRITVVDTSILTEVPTRGVLRRSIEKVCNHCEQVWFRYFHVLSHQSRENELCDIQNHKQTNL